MSALRPRQVRFILQRFCGAAGRRATIGSTLYPGGNMTDSQRQDFPARDTGLAAATVGGPFPAVAGDPSFMNNVPDPLLSGKELPTFKFALEKSEGKVVGKS